MRHGLLSLQTTGVLPSKLQLVGVASMYISAKMEVREFCFIDWIALFDAGVLSAAPSAQEVNAMPALEFARATAGATDGLEVKEMEAFILAVSFAGPHPGFSR